MTCWSWFTCAKLIAIIVNCFIDIFCGGGKEGVTGFVLEHGIAGKSSVQHI